MNIFLTILMLAVIVCNYSYVRMKLQVNSTLPEDKKFSWWNNDVRQVARKYKELYPDSMLWLVGRASYFVVLGLICGIVCLQLFKKL